MGILGLIIQLGTAIFVCYLGYTVELNYIALLVSPLGFIFGQLMRSRSQSSSRRREKGFNAIKAFISAYLTGLLAVAIFFGIGYGIMHILELRPAEGVGRYQ